MMRKLLGRRSFYPRVAATPLRGPAARQFATTRPLSNELGAAKQTKRSRFRFFRYASGALGLAVLGGLGYLGYYLYYDKHPREQLPRDTSKKRLVILGTGWGAVSILKRIDTSNYDITIVSPRNYFLFTPLLPSCATGSVGRGSIVESISQVIRQRRAMCEFIEGEAVAVDPYEKTIKIEAQQHEGIPSLSQELRYDVLVMAVGAQVSTFNIPGVKEHACFLKDLPDASRIRNRLIDIIEAVKTAKIDSATRKRLLHFVVVGAGPTGVELMGELSDLVEADLKRLDAQLASECTFTLVEALPNVLGSFEQRLAEYARKTLNENKINVLTNTAVKKITDSVVYGEKKGLDGSIEQVELPYGLLVWCGGNAPRPIVRNLIDAIPEQDGARRGLVVDSFLGVKGVKDFYALGDCACSGLAPTAQVACQQGYYVAKKLNCLAEIQALQEKVLQLTRTLSLSSAGASATERTAKELELTKRKIARLSRQTEFSYSHHGSLAYLGSENAIADLRIGKSGVVYEGRLGYFFWRSVYFSWIVAVRNKILLANDWLKVQIFGRDISRY